MSSEYKLLLRVLIFYCSLTGQDDTGDNNHEVTDFPPTPHIPEYTHTKYPGQHLKDKNTEDNITCYL